MLKFPGVYRVKCLANGMYYYGQAANIGRRFRQHLNDLKGNRHKNSILQNCFNKYGEVSICFELLWQCKPEELCEMEQYLIDSGMMGQAHLCMNLNPRADVGPSNKKPELWKGNLRKCKDCGEFKDYDTEYYSKGKNYPSRCKQCDHKREGKKEYKAQWHQEKKNDPDYKERRRVNQMNYMKRKNRVVL